MKKILLPLLSIALVALLFMGCSSSGNGELVGVKRDNLRTSRIPHGMVLIPGGTFIMGQSDQDITFAQIAQNRQVTVASFYMDESEISNSEYRQFVHWVRDSILIYNYLGDDSYFVQVEGSDERYIDWSRVNGGRRGRSLWNSRDPAVRERLRDMYYQGEDRVFGKDELDVRLLRYHYETYDLRAAATEKNDPTKRRSDFIRRDTILVYPDTTVWINDFSYAQNEPMAIGYFAHPSFDEYPVVGVTWKQAEAFNIWRSRLFDSFNNSQRTSRREDRQPYMLPSEAEWEYAARGGNIGTQYPWGGPSARNAKGCLMANFKPGRGNYLDDGAAYTAPVYSYFPNDFGLYNMAGNVAEWTSSTFNESASAFVHDLNPTYRYNATAGDPESLKRKVVRGGSWKDIGYFLQNSARAYEYQDTAKSFIGFRSVTAYLGVDRSYQQPSRSNH